MFIWIAQCYGTASVSANPALLLHLKFSALVVYFHTMCLNS